MFRSKLGFSFSLSIISLCLTTVEPTCSKGCHLALGSYYLWSGSYTRLIAEVSGNSVNELISYNPGTKEFFVMYYSRIVVPFPCDCIDGEFLAHVFTYTVRSGDTYDKIAETYYANLTTAATLERSNSYPANSSIPVNATVNVTVNCSCGNATVSEAYGLFVTYPLRAEDSLESIAAAANLSTDLLRRYNPGANFSAGSGLVYIPGRDKSGNYPPLKSSTGLSSEVIAGISLGVAMGALLVSVCIYCGFYKKKKVQDKILLRKTYEDLPLQAVKGISVDKSVEFSCEELAKATDEFSIGHKIGQGGFGSVYYAELRGERVFNLTCCGKLAWSREDDAGLVFIVIMLKRHLSGVVFILTLNMCINFPDSSWRNSVQQAAIKKMDMRATREFLAELKVLTRVHHLNLVRLIGYCVEGSLFLVYEYIENGNLSQHLHGIGWDPLPWSTRVQIALDSARGLEYIHEHTVPIYIHRDIKTANILIDKHFRAKVADFGLAKLVEAGGSTRLVGTFGYMPPEYAQYCCNISPKVDVYAFGVVLYELISAKEAIVKSDGSTAEAKGLGSLFEEALNKPDPSEDLCKLIDPRLGDNYPFDSVLKMAQLAKACTQVNRQLRPGMRSVVVALMTLSSSTEPWDVGSLCESSSQSTFIGFAGAEQEMEENLLAGRGILFCLILEAVPYQGHGDKSNYHLPRKVQLAYLLVYGVTYSLLVLQMLLLLKFIMFGFRKGLNATLSQGDVLTVSYGVLTYHLRVLELKPSSSVSVLETDIEADIVGPDAVPESTNQHVLKPLILGKSESGIVVEGHYIESDTQDGDTDLYISRHPPLFPTRHQHEWSSHDVGSKALILSSKDQRLGIGIYSIGVYGFKGTVKYQVSVTIQENQDRKAGQQAVSSSSPMEMDTVECRNCKHYIPSRTIALHEAYCSRHNVPCQYVGCGVVLRIEEVKNHIHCNKCVQAFPEEKEQMNGPSPDHQLLCCLIDCENANVFKLCYRGIEWEYSVWVRVGLSTGWGWVGPDRRSYRNRLIGFAVGSSPFGQILSGNSMDEILSYKPTTQISSMRTSSELESTSPSAATASVTEFLGHVFTYVPESRNTFDEVAKWDYANLTTAAMLIQYFQYYYTSSYAWFNVTVNCSCGDASVLKEHGFVHHVLALG
ncbi:hypothetical protein RHSIM_Rhsim04G0048100 [Rhododendron simsii]|uniref:Uncharacterized protein n=1 Tax=Rhododendron simsii TaxID=118357 RepID=A0A834LSB3_RHOSS|nr:hypothetical protein RHSIM_Rhsim04G0048100 [Rhododendron simsii]